MSFNKSVVVRKWFSWLLVLAVQDLACRYLDPMKLTREKAFHFLVIDHVSFRFLVWVVGHAEINII